MLKLKASIKVKIDVYVSLFLFYTKNFFILMEFRTPEVLRKVLLKLFLENYAIKVSYSAYFKVIGVNPSLLGAK